jgi:hypothetical protein
MEWGQQRGRGRVASSSRWARALRAATCLLLALHAQTSRAQDRDAAERALLPDLLRAGAEAARAKKWDACIEAYARAAATEESATTLGELGLCEEAAGRYPAAHHHLRRARAGLPASNADRYQAAFTRATLHVAVVFVSAQPSEAKILIDGRPMGAADGHGVALAPGKHTFSARLAGHEDAIETRSMEAGDLPHVHLVLRPKASATPDVHENGTASAPPAASEPTARAVSNAPLEATSSLGPPCLVPHWSPCGVMATLAYAASATALAGGATTIGIEVDRASLTAGRSSAACSQLVKAPGGEYVEKTSRPAWCSAVEQRRDQRDTAIGVTIGGGVATAVLWGLAGIAMGLDREPRRPLVSIDVRGDAGAIVVGGAW